MVLVVWIRRVCVTQGFGFSVTGVVERSALPTGAAVHAAGEFGDTCFDASNAGLDCCGLVSYVSH